MTVLLGITSSLNVDCKQMIGIMADSHGRLESIAAALGVSTGMDCRAIYHLGNVCDSTHPAIAEACLGSLRDPRGIIKKARMARSLLPNISAAKDRRLPWRFYGILETCLWQNIIYTVYLIIRCPLTVKWDYSVSSAT